jgi:hypothetical protein
MSNRMTAQETKVNRPLFAGPPETHPPGPAPDVYQTLRPECERRNAVRRHGIDLVQIGVSLLVLSAFIEFMLHGNQVLSLCLRSAALLFVFVALALILHWRRLTYIRWHCPGCDRTLNDHKCWYCSYCKTYNRTKSFLDRCGREGCKAVPLAYQCEHSDCGALTYFTPERNGRHPARFQLPDSPTEKAQEEIRSERIKKFEDYEFELKDLEYQAKIRLAKLRAADDDPSGTKRSIVEAAVREIDRITQECRTIADSAAAHEHFEAEIDARTDLDARLKDDIKNLAATKFAHFRLQRGGEISLDHEKRPSR